MHPNDAEWVANSVDTDQTAPQGAVWSESALFAQAYPRKLGIITVLLKLDNVSQLNNSTMLIAQLTKFKFQSNNC